MKQYKNTADIEAILTQQQAVVVQSEAWQAQLKEAVNDLINHHFDGLLQLLYRVDISEQKLRQLLIDFPAADAAAIISQLLVERQLQKIESRQAFAQRDDNIPEDERW